MLTAISVLSRPVNASHGTAYATATWTVTAALMKPIARRIRARATRDCLSVWARITVFRWIACATERRTVRVARMKKIAAYLVMIDCVFVLLFVCWWVFVYLFV